MATVGVKELTRPHVESPQIGYYYTIIRSM